jgi:hypothetical protein
MSPKPKFYFHFFSLCNNNNNNSNSKVAKLILKSHTTTELLLHCVYINFFGAAYITNFITKMHRVINCVKSELFLGGELGLHNTFFVIVCACSYNTIINYNFRNK